MNAKQHLERAFVVSRGQTLTSPEVAISEALLSIAASLIELTERLQLMHRTQIEILGHMKRS